MRRSLIVLVASGGLVLCGGVVPAPAQAEPGDGVRVCPTESFVVGAGWGADRGRRAHAGIDLGGKRGTPIYAIEDGVIDRTKRQSNGALQIVMQGGSGSKFYYGHMDKVLVKGGQRVSSGEVIGLMGDSGSPGAVHLHFEYWRSGGESAAVDPASLIEQVCAVRADGTSQDDGPSKGDGTATPRKPAVSEADQPDSAVQGDVFRN